MPTTSLFLLPLSFPTMQVNVLAPGLENAHLLEDTHQWGQEESRRRGSLLPQLRGGVYRDSRGALLPAILV